MTTPDRTPSSSTDATDATSADGTPGAAAHVGRALRVAAGLTAVEGLGVLGVATWFAVQTFRLRQDDPAMAWTGAVTLLLVASGLLIVSGGLLRGRRWSRAPAIVGQLLLAAGAYNLLSGPLAAVGVVLMALAISVFVMVLRPTSTETFQR